MEKKGKKRNIGPWCVGRKCFFIDKWEYKRSQGYLGGVQEGHEPESCEEKKEGRGCDSQSTKMEEDG